MKKMMIIALALAANSGIAVMAHAQAPSISGINDYDGSTPTRNNYYWSIYGSNLSNRTGGGGVASSIVDAEYLLSDGFDYLFNCCVLAESGTYQTPMYWYESPSQINFYFDAGEIYYYDPMEGQNEFYVPAGYAGVTVTNSNNQTSNAYDLTYNP